MCVLETLLGSGSMHSTLQISNFCFQTLNTGTPTCHMVQLETSFKGFLFPPSKSFDEVRTSAYAFLATQKETFETTPMR